MKKDEHEADYCVPAIEEGKLLQQMKELGIRQIERSDIQ